MAQKISPADLQLPAAGVFYTATGQALAAGRTALTIGSGGSVPSLTLNSKSLVLITIWGEFQTGANTYYPHFNVEVSSNGGSTWRDFSAAELMAPSAGSLGVNSFNTLTTTEQAGLFTLPAMAQLAAGTYQFRVTHAAGLATGTIGYSVTLQVALLSFQP